jgi:hypothetical protein
MIKIYYFKYLKRFFLYGLLFGYSMLVNISAVAAENERLQSAQALNENGSLVDDLNSADSIFNQQRDLRVNGNKPEPIVVKAKYPMLGAVIDSGVDYNHLDLKLYI